jgi:hypothetical protein
MISQHPNFPQDVVLEQPDTNSLPTDQRHFLTTIPWDDSYFDLVPNDLKNFFQLALPYLSARTTNVHVAICLSYLDSFCQAFADQNIDRKVLGLALILHDTGWSQLTEAEVAASLGVSGLALNQVAQGPKEKHAIESERVARQLLTEQQTELGLTDTQVELILQAVRYHDQPEKVRSAQNTMPVEVQALVDLDHLWSFTRLNFWQDTVRKQVSPEVYLENLAADLDSYFVTDFGKQQARTMWEERRKEVYAAN